jgi:hypothetical protein
VRAQGREARRGSRGHYAPGKKERRGKEGADSLGPTIRERKEGAGAARTGKRGADRRARAISKRKREKALWMSWAGCWAGRGPRGEGRGAGLQERGRPKREEGEKQAELRDGLGWVGLPFSFLSFSSFLFLFYTQTIQTNLFEFK